ncbi:hypothetical protein L198_08206 [Cryptococcus wingfieldii CBS 7118]|uniref:Mitochondrial protein n=1 Tax=Cryptococcus wingfieldii CBS 7118 TaxID=1295528 RepID=A0A1E3HEX0_9TREE|nr:hypothetical protein L198_08206 [Cryptococcus wingfieldii CBS 7118]ODN74899.1 hypothetical protein L198_08206 [Cryptococcus wingfieldii CBS 7118]
MTPRLRLPRPAPLLAASALALCLYAAHSQLKPIHLESLPVVDKPAGRKSKSAPTVFPLYTPVGWGSNRNLILSPDSAQNLVKKPTPLPHLGATPLRDLAIAEEYAAAVDANGDCWLWGKGYDESGKVGKGLRGKSLRTLAPAQSKIFALSKHGNLYLFSPSKAIHSKRRDKPTQSWSSYLFGADPTVDFVELKAEGGMAWGERWKGIDVGKDHLLAVTSKGRTFSLPLTENGNSHRQLGTKAELSVFDNTATRTLPPSKDIRYASLLSPIPSLANIPIAQVAAGERTSFVRTLSNHVLAFGANEAGQIGLGSSYTVEVVPVPVEVVLSKCYPTGTTVECQDIKAGGNTTFYTVQRSFPGRRGTFIDVLSCGSGLQGALGTGAYTSATGLPVKVKTISGLQEYSEKARTFLPIGIYDLAVSKSPAGTHAFAVLDTVREGGGREYGRDLVGWGANIDYQIGISKRSSTPSPIHLPRLGTKLPESIIDPTDLEFVATPQIPLPQDRLQLQQSRTKAYDLEGKLLKRGVRCEQRVAVGWGNTILYERIVE